MDIIHTNIEGLFKIKTNVIKDDRGSFQKIFNRTYFRNNGFNYDFKEFYFSISKINTIRGMHFQTPPHNHVKIVYVSYGSIIDVVVDLRKESTSFGQIFSTKLEHLSGILLYIPSGLAHGFKSLMDDTIVNYAQTSCYSKENDHGILYNSIDFDWKIADPIISKRDLRFPSFQDFQKKSPF